jgi:hypothetical protein
MTRLTASRGPHQQFPPLVLLDEGSDPIDRNLRSLRGLMPRLRVDSPCEATTSLWMEPMTSRRSVPWEWGLASPGPSIDSSGLPPPSAPPRPWRTCTTTRRTTNHGHRDGWGPVSTSREVDLTSYFEEGPVLSTLLVVPLVTSLFRLWGSRSRAVRRGLTMWSTSVLRSRAKQVFRRPVGTLMYCSVFYLIRAKEHPTSSLVSH